MSLLSAMKAEPFLGAFPPFFWGQFGQSDHVNIHGVRVFGGSQEGGERLEDLNGPSTLLSDLFDVVPLVLEMGSLGIPVIDFIWDGVKRRDPLHEQGRDSGSKEADEDIVVHDINIDNVALECGDVTLQGWRELSVLHHLVGRKLGDGTSGGVLVFKCCLEFPKEVVSGFWGYGSTSDGFFSEGICPGQDRPLGHV